MRVLLLLFCLLGLSLAVTLERRPRQCKSPPLLTGALTFVTQRGKARGYVRYEYDALQKRIRMYEVGKYHNQSFTSDILLLFNEGMMYLINDKARTCTKKPFQGDFHPMEVPADASLLASSVIGSSSIRRGGLLVNTWVGRTKCEVPYMVTVTDAGCVPVSVLYKTDDSGWVVVSYMNNVNGLLYPRLLNPPPFCDDAEVKPEEKPVDFLTVIDDIRKSAQ